MHPEAWPHDRQPTHESIPRTKEAPDQCEELSETQPEEEASQENWKEDDRKPEQEDEKEAEQEDDKEAEQEDEKEAEQEEEEEPEEEAGMQDEHPKEAEGSQDVPKHPQASPHSNQGPKDTGASRKPEAAEAPMSANPLSKASVAKVPAAKAPAARVPHLSDNNAPAPEKSQPSLSPGAIDKRLRRVMTPRTNGTFKVPEKFVQQWRKGGAQRKTLESILASCGYDVDSICCSVYL